MIVHLMHGVHRDGVWHRTAETRPITGAVEAMLADLPRDETVAACVTTLIASTTARIGSVLPTLDDIRSLPVGDRERLLAALLRANFGPTVDAVARCGVQACGETIEFEIDVNQLLPPRDPIETARWSGQPPALSTTVAADCGAWHAHFRLPNGGDLEAVAGLAEVDIGLAAARILERCVLDVRDGSRQPRSFSELTDDARRALGEELRRHDPQADTTLTLTCPACGTTSSFLLDLGVFLLRLVDRGGDVFTDVFRIARAYHWSEADILALPVSRRRRYIAQMSIVQEPA